jgi:hypothetical protein
LGRNSQAFLFASIMPWAVEPEDKYGDLHRDCFLAGFIVEIGICHACNMDAVATGNQ